MSYLVIARKYRPQKFSDITAQEHVTRTLRNAIRTGRIAHGYIFSGSRGVGKTTAARILAKGLNCEKVLKDDEYRQNISEPCGECESCRDFDAGSSLNISEFDAASNNGVDDIRTLRENVRYAPQKGRYKVYIIDEFHMLSNAAFNAFLKTLEEPPAHAVFIFATTELNKVPPTIASRCQKFNFKRISVLDIQTRLAEICDAENINIDADSLTLIARKADGAMRDAQSLLDQVISFFLSTENEKIQYADVASLLGDIDDEHFFAVTDSIKQKSHANVLALSRYIFDNGFDTLDFLARLVEHFRNFLLVKNLRSTKLIERTEAAKKRYETEAEEFSAEELMRFIEIINQAEKDIRFFREPQLRFELALLKLLHADISSTGTHERLSQFEQRLKTIETEIKKKTSR